MKQTAIDFLESEFNKWAEGRLFIPQHIIEQAKEMEKQQIIDFADEYGTYLLKGGTMSAASYNETFKSE
jgi:hypothetical protein